MKNLKKEIEELSDKEVKTILKSTVVCGVSLLVVGILTKKYKESIQMNQNLHSRRYMYMYYRRTLL